MRWQFSRDNPRLVCGLLFYAIAQAILAMGRKWAPLRAELGLITSLHEPPFYPFQPRRHGFGQVRRTKRREKTK